MTTLEFLDRYNKFLSHYAHDLINETYHARLGTREIELTDSSYAEVGLSVLREHKIIP